jgi:predicted  nucleic acid-binding Zn-ribbon protein
MKNTELVDMLKIQGDRIDNLVKKVKKLESKSDYLKKTLTFRVEELEEEAKESKSEIDDIFRALDAT